MTSVSGITVVTAPCCGARYQKPAFSSINMRGRQTWSDGYWFGELFNPRAKICECPCGAMFLTRDAEDVAYFDFDEIETDSTGEAQMADALPYLPVMRSNRIAQVMLSADFAGFTNDEIELEMRLAFWHLLNHPYRMLQCEEPTPSKPVRRLERGVLPEDSAHSTAQDDPVAQYLQNNINTAIPWKTLSESDVDHLITDNLAHLLPLLETHSPDANLLIGEANRALGQMDAAMAHFRMADSQDNLVTTHLINLSESSERHVVRIEPPDWEEPVIKPEPWVNPHPSHGCEVVPLQSRYYWFQVFGMLQQGWVLVEPCHDDVGVMLYKIDDNSEIYAQRWFEDAGVAEAWLAFTGYRRYDDDQDAWTFLVPPGGPFQLEHGIALKGSPRSRVKRLMNEGLMPMQWPPRLDEEPAPPFAEDLADKVAGMLLGLAIGDALGNSSESLLPNDRHRRYGWITDYLPNRHAGNAIIGLPSDDTQLAFWTLEHLIECGELDPARLANKFSERRIFGLGQSVRQFLRDYKAGTDWRQAGAPSAGNGALMRIAPMLVPHLFDPSLELWTDTLLAAHITHRDALSNVACLAFVDLLWHWIGEDEFPVSEEWLERFATFCADIEPDTHYQPRGGHPPGFSGTLSEMIRTYVMPALEQQLPVVEACAIWHSGAYLLETVPSVLYILARHGHDPEAAILSAVNETKDNDTIAAIVGAAMGALHGRSKLPPRWVEGLSGRTMADDDRRVFVLIEKSAKKFGYGE
jgi:ADP-ribosylglycohydrolase